MKVLCALINILLVFSIFSPVLATEPMPIIPPEPPMPNGENIAYIVAKVNEDGYAAILSTYSIINKGTEDMSELTVLIPYAPRDVKVYYAKQQGWESYTVEEYVDEKGNVYDVKTFDDALELAGVANFSAVDVDEKAVNGLVYAVIKYPYNQTKNELVWASVYKDYAIRYNGWDKVPMVIQQDLSINVRLKSHEERRYIDKDISTKIIEKYGQTLLELDLPYAVKPEESTKIVIRYKVLDKITFDNLRSKGFTLSLALPVSTFNAIITVMVPKHDIFKFTKPEHDLQRVSEPVYYKYRDYGIKIETFSTRAIAVPEVAKMAASIAEVEEKMIQEESEAGDQTYFENSKAYRLALFDITPDEKFVIAGWYTDKKRYYAAPMIALVFTAGLLILVGRRRIKKYIW